MNPIPLLFSFTIDLLTACGQSATDSTTPAKLKEVKIRAWQRNDIDRLSEEQAGFLTSGRKNEVISPGGTNANITIKKGRQTFSKIYYENSLHW